MNREQKIVSLCEQFRALGIDKQIDYDKFYLYSLITHSTAIEGSTVTEIENQLLFDEGISAAGRSMTEQLMNLDLKAAYELAIDWAKQHRNLSVEMLKQLAAAVMKHTGSPYNTALGTFSSAEGELRLLNVTAGPGGRSYMNYAKVPDRLAALCEQLNQRRKILSATDIVGCYTLSFDAHFQLVTIHPWADGNGRMSRLLMHLLQFEFGLIPSNLHKDRKAAYIEALIATREQEDLSIFRHFMFDEHIRQLEQTIQQYQVSMADEGMDVGVNVGVNVGINVGSSEQQALDLLRADSRLTAKALAEALHLSLRQGERLLASLKEKGLIRRQGSNKSGHWEVV